MLRRNTDEANRDLERVAKTGDRQAALRLLAAWRRSGDLAVNDWETVVELTDHELLGWITVTVRIPAPVRSNPSPVYCDLWFRGIRRSPRLMGVVIECRASSVSYLLERLRSENGEGFDELLFLQSVVAPTEARGTVNTSTVEWPGAPAHAAPLGPSVAMRRTLRLLWRDDAFRATFMRAALRADLAHRVVILDERAAALEQAEDEATISVLEELERRPR